MQVGPEVRPQAKEGVSLKRLDAVGAVDLFAVVGVVARMNVARVLVVFLVEATDCTLVLANPTSQIPRPPYTSKGSNSLSEQACLHFRFHKSFHQCHLSLIAEISELSVVSETTETTIQKKTSRRSIAARKLNQ
jgi:hypothetical protein